MAAMTTHDHHLLQKVPLQAKFNPEQTTLMLDKTGVITTNLMLVNAIFINNELISVPAKEADWKTLDPIPSLEILGDNSKMISMATLNDSSFELLSKAMALCNTAVFADTNHSIPVEERLCHGSATDMGLIQMVEKNPSLNNNEGSLNKIDVIRNNNQSCNGEMSKIPFNSKFRLTANVFQMDKGDTVIMSGLASSILSRCSTVLVNGEVVPLDTVLETRFVEVLNTIAERGDRSFAFAYRVLENRPEENWCGGSPETANYPIGSDYLNSKSLSTVSLDDGLTFLGIVSFTDPIRPSAPLMIKQCRESGCKVMMITGDQAATGASIARTVGILTSDKIGNEENSTTKSKVIQGTELTNLSESDLDSLIKDHDELLFCRMAPLQKLQIVQSEMNRGRTVVFIGDGMNDAPAIQGATYGISMGISGHVAAKEAADAILLSDDFTPISSLF